MNPARAAAFAVACIAAVAAAGEARAQLALGNTNVPLVGDRAVGMGGAFTGLSGDASALFYNPAGLGVLMDERVTLDGSAFALYRDRAVGRIAVVDPDGRERRTDDASTGFFNFTASLIKTFRIRPVRNHGERTGFTNHNVAVGIVIPGALQRESRATLASILPAAVGGAAGDRGTLRGYSDNSLFQVRNTYLLGAGWGASMGRNWSVGAAVWFVYANERLRTTGFDSRRFTSEAGPNRGAVAGVETTQSLDRSADTFAVTGQFGLLGQFDGWSVGVTYRTPTHYLLSFGNARLLYQRRVFSTADGWRPPITAEGDALLILSSSRFESEYRLPGTIAFGVGYEDPGKWAVCLDVRYVLPSRGFYAVRRVRFERIDAGDQTGNEDAAASAFRASSYVAPRVGALNVSAGAETYLAGGHVPLRAGFFTDFSLERAPLIDNVQASGLLPPDRIHYVGGTVMSGWDMLIPGTAVETTIGLALIGLYGWGSGVGTRQTVAAGLEPQPLSYAVVPISRFALIALVTGTIVY